VPTRATARGRHLLDSQPISDQIERTSFGAFGHDSLTNGSRQHARSSEFDALRPLLSQRASCVYRPWNWPTRVVVGAYVALALLTLGWSVATRGWVTSTTRGIVVLVLAVLLLLALVPLRQRWAWWLYVFGYAVAVVSILWESSKPLPYVEDVVVLLLLLSPQMRDYVFDRPRRGPIHSPGESTIAWLRARRK
jgi:hypothetical protein